MKKIDLTGQRFGRLFVIKEAENTRAGRVTWLCKCDCGKETTCNSGHLRSGKILSCGCYQAERRGISQRDYVGEISGDFWYNHIVRSANGNKGRRHPVELSISKEYCWNLFLKQDRKCALSGIPIYFPIHGKANYTASLDRIDSSKGYIEGNVQWVHKNINWMKNRFSQDYFIDMCKKVAFYNE